MSSGSLGPNGAGPTIDVAGPYFPPSPAETLMELIKKGLDPRIISPHNIVVGPADNQQQRDGVVQITDAGSSNVVRGAPLIFGRGQLRLLHNTVDGMDRLGYHIYSLVHARHREIITFTSTGAQYLVHRCNVLAGPSAHFDSQVTWENLMFVEIVIGTVPVFTAT